MALNPLYGWSLGHRHRILNNGWKEYWDNIEARCHPPMGE